MRLLTRSDFDGLACGALLKSIEVIDRWLFVHPKDVQDGRVEVTRDDVLANVPYVPGCGMWFDHHTSEMTRIGKDVLVPGECRPAPSAARVIYDYYDGQVRLPHFSAMIAAVDKVDAGQLTVDEIQAPEDWMLLGFIMDPRTGLGRFRDFTISNYELMVHLLDCCATMDIDEILALPDVRERVELYHKQTELFKRMLLEKSHTEANVIITDLRGETNIYAGNRFLIYSLFPEQNVSVWIVDGRNKTNNPVAVGYSIVNRTCKSNIGDMMLEFGGGGHEMVGTCQIPHVEADRVIRTIVRRLIEEDAEL